MSETKTVEQWLQELPEPYRSQALDNMDADGDGEELTITSALSAAFVWQGTPQGHKYWEGLHVKLGGDRSSVVSDGIAVSGGRGLVAPAWIKVSDRLPDFRKEFSWSHALVTAYAQSTGVFPAECSVYQDRDIVWYDLSSADSDGDCDRISDVTHWMPLPDPPKED